MINPNTNPGAGLTAKLAEKFKAQKSLDKQSARRAVDLKNAERKQREASRTEFFNASKHKCWLGIK